VGFWGLFTTKNGVCVKSLELCSIPEIQCLDPLAKVALGRRLSH
jgi:hypothetical protein